MRTALTALLACPLVASASAQTPAADGEKSSRSVESATTIQSPDTKAQQTGVAAQFAALPMRFEANAGQTDARVEFLARGNGYTVFLTADESVMVLDRHAPL
ncbi:MAG: hypothetical protein ABIP49_07255, partial [Lysobacterales bacterium]